MDKFEFLTAAQAPRIAPGTIMFLPPKDRVCNGAYTDPELHTGAYNHPVVIISCPEDQPMKHHSLVEVAIMTSFNGTSIRKHLAAKGIEIRTEALAAQRAGYLRVVTTSKPHTHDTLKLRNGKGMKRDCSYVGIRETYRVQLSALALYGSAKEEVDRYRLTGHATKRLVEAVGDAAAKRCRGGKARNRHEGKPNHDESKTNQKEFHEEEAEMLVGRVEKVELRLEKAKETRNKVARKRQQIRKSPKEEILVKKKTASKRTLGKAGPVGRKKESLRTQRATVDTTAEAYGPMPASSTHGIPWQTHILLGPVG
ncbi:uncharacterized protein BP5553_09550 [Venustampulla echinocandica]|uniref:Uncharacterized protein n=1 Tax=Venustampulla echinocandica TaxID=2656787 RepID=A0A370TBA6_9HELO|nr:uncharacterized protein BP5553_09550 [Venustampulla echinocandica]RDL31341.1 hypothetical protein BP5553_09550 [Venustampulla echinocandica]